MKKYILSLVMLLICSITASAQQFKVMKGEKNVKTWTINQVDSIAVDEVEGVEVFKLMLKGKTVATYNRSQADRVEICKGIMVSGIYGVPATKQIYLGKVHKLDASVNEDASDQTLSWSSSDESVVITSQDGHLAPLKRGTANITVKANDGSNTTANCDLKVVQLVETLKLDTNSKTIERSTTDVLANVTVVSVGPDDADDKTYTWSSTDSDVASVDTKGAITAKKAGTATIKATANDEGKMCDSCIVTVKQLVTSISLNKTTAQIATNKTDTLEATVGPEDATDKSLTWTSSNTSVATVDSDGVVKGIAQGTTTITATTKDDTNLSASCSVTVYLPDPNLLPGVFSVSAEKTVNFTRSNLYWNGSTYKFEDKQTDYQTTWDENHIDHFSWTKSEENSRLYTYNDGTNATTDRFWLDGMTDDHKLTVEGTSGLYVLSKAEWEYLLNGRAYASSLCKRVAVDGKAPCLVIAPDGYTGTIESSYTAEAWADAEADGLVCLPPAGSRSSSSSTTDKNKTTITRAGEVGYYKTSTPSFSDVNNNFYLRIEWSKLQHEDNRRYFCDSIRLVKTAE